MGIRQIIKGILLKIDQDTNLAKWVPIWEEEIDKEWIKPCRDAEVKAIKTYYLKLIKPPT